MESPLSARWRAESTAALCAASGRQQSFGRQMRKVFLKSNVACSHDHDDKVHSLCCQSLAFYLVSGSAESSSWMDRLYLLPKAAICHSNCKLPNPNKAL